MRERGRIWSDDRRLPRGSPSEPFRQCHNEHCESIAIIIKGTSCLTLRLCSSLVSPLMLTTAMSLCSAHLSEVSLSWLSSPSGPKSGKRGSVTNSYVYRYQMIRWLFILSQIDRNYSSVPVGEVVSRLLNLTS